MLAQKNANSFAYFKKMQYLCRRINQILNTMRKKSPLYYSIHAGYTDQRHANFRQDNDR